MGCEIRSDVYYSVSDTVSLIDIQSRNSINDPSRNAMDGNGNQELGFQRWCSISKLKWPKSRLFLMSVILFSISMMFFVLACITTISSSPRNVDTGKGKHLLININKSIDTHNITSKRRNSSCLSLSSMTPSNTLNDELVTESERFVQLDAGNILNLWCSISDKQLSDKINNVTINWSRGDKLLGIGNGIDTEMEGISIIHYRFSVTNFVSFLTMTATEKDSGEYFCSLNFPYEHCREKITVKITKKSVSGSGAQVPRPTTESINTIFLESSDSEKEPMERLIFSENFNSLNVSRMGSPGTWRYEQGYTNFDILTRSHSTSYTKDGILYLKPILTNDIHGEEFLYNGTLFLGEEPFEEICKEARQDTDVCWRKGHPEDIVHPVMVPVMRSVFGFVYGKVEIRAKMPTGDWITPIISLVPEFSTYGKSNSFESGLVQMVNTNGNKILFDSTSTVNKGVESNCPALRYGTKHFPTILSFCLNKKEGFDSDFHLYQLEWTPNSIVLSIDGEKLIEAPCPGKTMFDHSNGSGGSGNKNPWKFPLASNEKMAPFDHFFSMRIGLSVGGTDGTFPDDYRGAYQKPWNNSDPKASLSFWENRDLWNSSWKGEDTALKIDYIKVWELRGTKYSFDSLY